MVNVNKKYNCRGTYKRACCSRHWCEKDNVTQETPYVTWSDLQTQLVLVTRRKILIFSAASRDHQSMSIRLPLLGPLHKRGTEGGLFPILAAAVSWIRTGSLSAPSGGLGLTGCKKRSNPPGLYLVQCSHYRSPDHGAAALTSCQLWFEWMEG